MKYINIEKYIKWYLLFYCLFVLFYINTGLPLAAEFDDYALPSISIMKDFSFSFTRETLEDFKRFFPEYAIWIEVEPLQTANYWEDGKNILYTTKDGNRMLTWYFPTYSAFAIPFIKIMQLFKLNNAYAYVYLNVFFFFAFLYLILNYLKINEIKKLFLILLVTLNPIILYLRFVSNETLLYSLIGICFIFWHRRSYYRAAFFISLAGTMNNTVMIVGLGIILTFFYELFKKYEFKILKAIKDNIKPIIYLGLCFIISMFPMIYFYYHTGHINLTSAVMGTTDGSLERFIAYLFDLNFGFLPYYTFIFLISIVMLVVAFKKKQWNYIGLFTIFLFITYLYSLVFHINCGMLAIARYNAWNAIIMIFAVILCIDKIFDKKLTMYICNLFIIISIVLSVIVVKENKNISSVQFTTVASLVLKNYPQLYNPLFSTFNSRLNNIDGGYHYTTPLIFTDKNGYIRKILASKKDIDELKNIYKGLDKKSAEFFKNELNNLSNEESYISIDRRYKIIKNDR